MTELQIITENRRAIALLDGFDQRAADLRPALENARGVARSIAGRQFDSADGWKPSKKRRGRTGIVSGALRASFTGGAGSVERVGPQTLEVRSALPHAHLFTGGRPRQPARPVYLHAGDRESVARLRAAIAGWIMDGRRDG